MCFVVFCGLHFLHFYKKLILDSCNEICWWYRSKNKLRMWFRKLHCLWLLDVYYAIPLLKPLSEARNGCTQSDSRCFVLVTLFRQNVKIAFILLPITFFCLTSFGCSIWREESVHENMVDFHNYYATTILGETYWILSIDFKLPCCVQ